MNQKWIRSIGLLVAFSGPLLATPITIGSLSDYALYAGGAIVNFNSDLGGFTGATNVLDGLSFATATPGSGVNFIGGGAYVMPIPPQVTTDFNTLVSTLGGLSYTPLVSWVGLAPGNYTFDDSTPLPSTVNLSTAGTYAFKYTGSNLLISGTTVNLGPQLTNDDVFWFIPTSLTLSNSNFAGDIVGTGSISVTANIAPPGTSITQSGRVFAAGALVTNGLAGSSLNFELKSTGPESVPEPSTLAFLTTGLGAMVIAIRRRR